MFVFSQKLVVLIGFCWILGVAGEAQQCTTLGHVGGRGDNGPIMVLTGVRGGNVGHVPVAVFCGVPRLFGTFGCIYIYVLLEKFSFLKLLFLMMFCCNGIYE